MPTVEEYKIAILRQLIEGAAEGPGSIVNLRIDPSSDQPIRAIAELVTEGVLVFDEDSWGCLLTDFGARKAEALIRKLEMLQKRK